MHCAILPIALALFPSFIALTVDDTTFHNLMLWLVIPSSLLAVSLGCWQHKDKHVLILAFTGIVLLVAVNFLGHQVLGEIGEKIASLTAAALLTSAHWRNFKLCNHEKCTHKQCA